MNQMTIGRDMRTLAWRRLGCKMQKTLFDGISSKPHDRDKARRAERARKRYAANPEKFKERERLRYAVDKEKKRERFYKWRKANAEKQKARLKAWIAANPERVRLRRIKEKYGLRPDEFRALYDKQNGACAICAKPFTSSKNTHVDHDHESGKIRGLLCSNCNSALGLMRENTTILRKAAEYLDLSRS